MKYPGNHWIFASVLIALLAFRTQCSALGEEIYIDLEMPYKSLSPGMPCGLNLKVTNYGNTHIGARLYLALNVGTDEYWFYPGWVQYPGEIAWMDLEVPRDFSKIYEIIPEFSWPDNVGNSNNLRFYAVMDDPLGLISNLAMTEFNFVDAPTIDSLVPAAGCPGTILAVSGTGLNLNSDTVQLKIGEYRFDALTRGYNADGSGYLTGVIPPLEPGHYPVTIITNGHSITSEELTVEDFPEPGWSSGQVMIEVTNGFNHLCNIYRDNIISNAVLNGLISQENQRVYQEAVQRSHTLFHGFVNQYENLEPGEQQFLENVLVQSGMHDILVNLTTGSGSKSFISSDKLLLNLDIASTVLDGLNICWTAMDTTLLLNLAIESHSHTHLSGIILGCHMAFNILDQLLDQFLTTELIYIQFADLSPDEPLILPIEEKKNCSLTGIFNVQDPPSDVTFRDIMDLLAGNDPWFDDHREPVIQWIESILETLDYAPTDKYLGDDLLNMGPPDSIKSPLGFQRFTETYDMSNLIQKSFFAAAEDPVLDLMNRVSSTSCESGIQSTCASCENCLEMSFDNDMVTFRSLDCSDETIKLKLWFNWYTFTPDETNDHFEVPALRSTAFSYQTDCDIPKGFSYIPPGTFLMGSPDDERCRYDDEGPVHAVTITRGFFMKQTEVTQKLWMQYMDPNPSRYVSDNRPVELVPWSWACVFCNRYSLAEGLSPCYYIDEEYTIIYEEIHCCQTPAYWDQSANGYRFPTEAEWEYACRAGSSGPYYNGKTNLSCMGHDKNLSPLAWYWDNANFYTMPVAQKLPNRWNLYDMLGNVREWCWDIFDKDYYKYSPSIDPIGPYDGYGRALRGGCYDDWAHFVRCGDRLNFAEDYISSSFGFRIVRSRD